jgi:DNA-binding XRE family transcriptional regulator
MGQSGAWYSTSMTNQTTYEELIHNLYGGVNPIRHCRDSLQFTQHDLAQTLGYTDQVITNLESGLMQSLPQPLSDYLEIPQSHYLIWVRWKRGQNERYFRNATIRTDLERVSSRWLPFRESVSASFRGFCRRAVLQPSILRDFELHRQRNRYVISEALADCRVGNESLRDLGLPVG